jgi:hypothetical protein
MATTTPNYGWAVPTSTDLVKDGATAIETLGDAIDASMNTALGTKKAGMVLLNTTSFSGVASQSISTVFSSTYDHYRIIGRVFGDANRTIQWRIRSGSTDLTTSTYFFGGIFVGSAASQTFGSDNNANATSNLVTYVSTDVGTFDMVLYNPFGTLRTGYTCNGQGRSATYYAGLVDNTTSYDGITFLPNAGTITGEISIYGVNK